MARWRFNTFPAYRGSGGRVTFIRHDFMEVRIKLPLWWQTKNYVGTIFGGSMYASVDPFYMMMLIQCLGRCAPSARLRAQCVLTYPCNRLLQDCGLPPIRSICASRS